MNQKGLFKKIGHDPVRTSDSLGTLSSAPDVFAVVPSFRLGKGLLFQSRPQAPAYPDCWTAGLSLWLGPKFGAADFHRRRGSVSAEWDILSPCIFIVAKKPLTLSRGFEKNRF
jgi:hypothetical protein